MKKKLILVVEDDQAIQEVMREVLVGEEYLVQAVYDGNEALIFLKDKNNENLPDLILLDIMMPNKDGEEFCNEISTDPILSSIPVIIISAAGNLTPKQKSLGNAYIAKPFEIDVLIREMKKQLERGTIKNGDINTSRTSSKESHF